MKTLTYRGDRTGQYDHGRGTGLVGKVVGPNLRHRWFLIVGATYDPETDRTTCTLERVIDPERAYERMVSGE